MIALRRLARSIVLLAAGMLLGNCADSTAPCSVCPVTEVRVTPEAAVVWVDGTVQLSAVPHDEHGRVLADRQVAWRSVNTAVVTVDDAGNARGVAVGMASVIATSESVSDTIDVTVISVSFGAVTAGTFSTCRLATNGVYCWGMLPGRYPQFSGVPELMPGGLVFSTLAAGGGWCGLTTRGAPYCWQSFVDDQYRDSPIPVALPGGHEFVAISTGWAGGDVAHGCGLTTAASIYCWGGNQYGQLGGGFFARSASCGGLGCEPTPVKVTRPLKADGQLADAELHFKGVAAGGDHTCALTTGGEAYCWGEGRFGKVGNTVKNDSVYYDYSAPVAVVGGLRFSMLTARAHHTCGLTTAGDAYCWGVNNLGDLGIGSAADSISPEFGVHYRGTPAAVAGGLRFSSITAGANHTCGIAQDGAAWCWGSHEYGQLGVGDPSVLNDCTPHPDYFSPCSPVPLRVAGDLTFAQLSAGWYHTCGVTMDNVAYCWGAKHPNIDGRQNRGELGTGDFSHSPVPVRVANQP